MCEYCWNADKEGKKQQEHCPHTPKDPYLITFELLKAQIVKKWIETGNKHFRVYKRAVFNPPQNSYVWQATDIGDNGLPIKKEKLSIHFI